MIDKMELLEKARELRLSFLIVEKDYVLGWLLYGMKEKCKIKEIRFSSIDQIFPFDIESALSPYWIQELGRLLNPLPDLHSVLENLKAMLKFLES